MKTSDLGINFIKVQEGEILHGYLDSSGYLTVGVGHLVKKGEPYKLHQPITAAESTRLLREDLGDTESFINRKVKVELNQNQFDALVSLVFNIGGGNFAKSQVLADLNRGDYDEAADAFHHHVYSRGQRVAGLVTRRNREIKLFNSPNHAPAHVKTTPPAISPGATNTIGEVHTADDMPNQLEPIQSTGTVEIPLTKPSLFTKIGVGITAITGIGFNIGSFLQTKLEEMPLKQIGFMLGMAGLVALAIWWYNKSAHRSNETNKQLIDTAANPFLNNVVPQQ